MLTNTDLNSKTMKRYIVFFICSMISFWIIDFGIIVFDLFHGTHTNLGNHLFLFRGYILCIFCIGVIIAILYLLAVKKSNVVAERILKQICNNDIYWISIVLIILSIYTILFVFYPDTLHILDKFTHQ